MSILAIIPARYASSRFPGKPLALIGGKSMIRRVYEQASKASLIDEVVVATDDGRIFDHVKSFKGQVLNTSDQHRSGTDRCAEVLTHIPDAEIIVNVQGDEPFIDPDQIDQLVQFLQANPDLGIATLAKLTEDPAEIFDPNVVKVVFSQDKQALYFSRSPIPHVRETPNDFWPTISPFYKHLGLYAYRSEVLRKVSSIEPTALETAESLEQLRWLENGMKIGVSITSLSSMGVDTPEDLNRAEQWWEHSGKFE